MKRAAIVCLVLLAFGCRSAKLSTDDVVKRQTELNRAFLENDDRALDKLLARDFTFHFIDHDMTARANAPRTRGQIGPPMSSSILDVRIEGPFAVVVSHYNWASFEGHLIDVWVHRRRQWRLLASTADVLPPYR